MIVQLEVVIKLISKLNFLPPRVCIFFFVFTLFALAHSLTVNPHAPDRFTPLRARCTEKCGSALIHR